MVVKRITRVLVTRLGAQLALEHALVFLARARFTWNRWVPLIH